MANMGVKKYFNGNITWACAYCLKENTNKVPVKIEFLPEFGSYQNPTFTCTHCQSSLTVNMNIPVSEYEELSAEVEEMPFYEIDARKQIRDAIFAHRADMKALNTSQKDSIRLSNRENSPYWKEKMVEVIENYGSEK